MELLIISNVEMELCIY